MQLGDNCDTCGEKGHLPICTPGAGNTTEAPFRREEGFIRSPVCQPKFCGEQTSRTCVCARTCAQLRDYFKDLACAIVGAGKSTICRTSRQARNSGRLSTLQS